MQVRVESTLEVLHLMEIGSKNRAVGATSMNEHSSRSHWYVLNRMDFVSNGLMCSSVCICHPNFQSLFLVAAL